VGTLQRPPQEHRYQVTDRLIAAIKAERAAGYQQQDLCRLVGISPVTLSRWLHRHKYARPSPEDQRLKRIARVLDLRPEECLEVVP
jgi:transcriptional regulator with XRE-family HTH domain